MTPERLIAALRKGRKRVIADLFTDAAGVAFLLGKSERTLREWRASGEGPPATMLGGSPIYDFEDLSRWLGDRRVDETRRRDSAERGEERRAAAAGDVAKARAARCNSDTR